MEKKLYTSESVTCGHPDKVCDQISDAVLDACLEGDPFSRVACETAISADTVFIFGEISSQSDIDLRNIAVKTLKEIGYLSAADGFDPGTAKIVTSVSRQSSDISRGVDFSYELRKTGSDVKQLQNGAGDQGMMYGYATDETPDYMPLSIALAHRLAKRLDYIRKEKLVNYLRPDGKTQVTVEYQNGEPARIDTIVLAAQHNEEIDSEQLRQDMIDLVIKPETTGCLIDKATKIYINTTGRFVIGGPKADCGLTGRKIIVDTYGGIAKHGGGAFSGKDCTKVDRSAAYFARYIAKNLVAAKLAKRCEVQLSYAIGVAEPVSVNVESFGTGKLEDQSLIQIVRDNFNMCPTAIIEKLKLRKVRYKNTAAYGHFGNSDYTWEKLDMAGALSKYLEAGN